MARFKKGESGNPNGRPAGSKSERIKQWEELGESITGKQAEKFNEYLIELWENVSSEKKQAAAELYLKTLEYFKPKLSRADVNQKNVHDFSRPIIIKKTYKKEKE